MINIPDTYGYTAALDSRSLYRSPDFAASFFLCDQRVFMEYICDMFITGMPFDSSSDGPAISVSDLGFERSS